MARAGGGGGGGGGITNAVNVGIAVQADWENREFISHISLNIRRLFDFLIQFESTTKSKLSSLNLKLDTLERRLQLLELQVVVLRIDDFQLNDYPMLKKVEALSLMLDVHVFGFESSVVSPWLLASLLPRLTRMLVPPPPLSTLPQHVTHSSWQDPQFHQSLAPSCKALPAGK
ncbi:hypothetical protein POTOM_047455 [Populus tomentosa]|uniref:Uncharacterized protein n=1 Tax=Populus tomentosa TaxID=118781 RepID=A0A8X7YB11_POPTO|nr:hypothetical protein POTOM_047455 [Populus tomentosa]